MTKQEVFEVIRKHILDNLDDVEENQIEITGSMKDYGANSLDMIEIVSVSMRELKIKVPRTELVNVKSIEGLVDKFMEHMN